MIQPALRDETFLADVAAAANERSPELLAWWLGQSGFLIGHAGEFMVFDPYLSDSLTRKYAVTQKPHVRMTARVVDPGKLDFVSAVTSTHNHTDHLDAETLGPIFAAAKNARLVLPAANVAFAMERLGLSAAGRLVPLAQGERTTVGSFTFECVPAAHEELSSEYAGFVMRVGGYTLYHSGDTVRFPGMAERLRPFGIDLALLPINGRSPERKVSGNLDGEEAATLAHDIGARWVVPCHYDMFEFNTARPEKFQTACARLGQNYAVLQAGERWSLPV